MIDKFEEFLVSDGVRFIENYPTQSSGQKITLDPWQRGYMRDTSALKFTKKSRRTGFTFIEAAIGLWKSQMAIRDTMPYVYEKHFLSRNLNDAQEFIVLARYLFDCLPVSRRHRLVSETKRELVFEDALGRKSRLKAHTANEPRGIGGDIVLDEAAFMRNFSRLYAAGQFVISLGGELSIGSSPAAASGRFYEIAINKDGLYPGFKRRTIPWWFSPRLCVNVMDAWKNAPSLSTQERVEKYGTVVLKQIFFSSLLEEFQQEAECMFADETSTFFPYELLSKCAVEEYGSDRRDSEIDLAFDSASMPGEREPDHSFWKWVRDSSSGIVECGCDVGRKKDIFTIVVTDSLRGKRDVRAIVTLSNKAFDIQEKVINDCIEIVKPVAFRYDNTGLGMANGERIQKRWGSIVQLVNFTSAWKAKAATNLKYLLEKQTIRLPNWRVLIDNLHSIKKETNSRTSNITFEADAGDHHGDIAWGLMLACYGDDNTQAPLSIGSFYPKPEPEVVMHQDGPTAEQILRQLRRR